VPPTVEVLDVATGRSLLSRPTVSGWQLRRPAIARDGSSTAFARPDGEVEIVEVDTGATTVIPDSAAWTASLDFAPDGGLLAGSAMDGSVAVWDLRTGELVASLEAHGEPVPVTSSEAELGFRGHQVLFRPDGSELATGGYDGTVRVWDPATDRIRRLHTFGYEVFSLAYSPDGTRLAAADGSGTLVVLDADTGAVVGEPERVSGGTEVVFAPDGRSLAGAGPGPLAHLWDLDSGRIVRRFHGAVYTPRSAAFVNGGSELRVAGGDGTDRGYLLEVSRLVDVAREQVTRRLTDTECLRHLGRVCDG
jgi:WD40 repeat protein